MGRSSTRPRNWQDSTCTKTFKTLSSKSSIFAEDALKEDSGLFAPRWEMDDLTQATRKLNQDIDRLEARLQQLNTQLQPSQD